MPQHDGQLELTAQEADLRPVVVHVVLPDRFVKLLRRLTPGGALRFASRAPVVLQDLLEEIIAVGQLPDRELDQRLRRHRADAERLADEQQRRMDARDPSRLNDDAEDARGHDVIERPSPTEL